MFASIMSKKITEVRYKPVLRIASLHKVCGLLQALFTPHTILNVSGLHQGLSHLANVEDCQLNNYHLPIVKIVIWSFWIGVEMQRVIGSQASFPL